MVDKTEVSGFLQNIGKLIDEGAVILVPREKNNQGIVELGITKLLAIAEIRGFTVAQYSSGPDPDHAVPGQCVWIFGCDISGKEAYVKLIQEALPNGRSRLKVLSFHPAARPLVHPYA